MTRKHFEDVESLKHWTASTLKKQYESFFDWRIYCDKDPTTWQRNSATHHADCLFPTGNLKHVFVVYWWCFHACVFFGRMKLSWADHYKQTIQNHIKTCLPGSNRVSNKSTSDRPSDGRKGFTVAKSSSGSLRIMVQVSIKPWFILENKGFPYSRCGSELAQSNSPNPVCFQCFEGRVRVPVVQIDMFPDSSPFWLQLLHRVTRCACAVATSQLGVRLTFQVGGQSSLVVPWSSNSVEDLTSWDQKILEFVGLDELSCHVSKNLEGDYNSGHPDHQYRLKSRSILYQWNLPFTGLNQHDFQMFDG